jgi:hypothetical protein
MVNKDVLQEKFKENLLEFFSELVIQFPKEADFILLRIILKEMSADVLINHFIKDILHLKDKVIQRDSTFFLENQLLYLDANIDENKTNHFKELWQKDIDDEDRDTIWEWFDVLINISEQYTRL